MDLGLRVGQCILAALGQPRFVYPLPSQKMMTHLGEGGRLDLLQSLHFAPHPCPKFFTCMKHLPLPPWSSITKCLLAPYSETVLKRSFACLATPQLELLKKDTKVNLIQNRMFCDFRKSTCVHT